MFCGSLHYFSERSVNTEAIYLNYCTSAPSFLFYVLLQWLTFSPNNSDIFLMGIPNSICHQQKKFVSNQMREISWSTWICKSTHSSCPRLSQQYHDCTTTSVQQRSVADLDRNLILHIRSLGSHCLSPRAFIVENWENTTFCLLGLWPQIRLMFCNEPDK